eukprot:4480773-Alexandrium_andersonii.AAC.1
MIALPPGPRAPAFVKQRADANFVSRRAQPMSLLTQGNGTLKIQEARVHLEVRPGRDGIENVA